MSRLRFEECKKCLDWNGNRGHCASICMKPYEAMDEFNKYKDLEEQGLLLKLPCKVGDTVFGFQFPRTDMTVVSREKVERIAIETNDAFYDLEDFGEEFFLTKSEAEKALEEMEK